MTEDEAGPESSDGSSESEESHLISRRKILAGIGGIGVGSAIGVGYAILGNEMEGRAIEPEQPNDDGEATLGEFHYILENAGAENARLDVTEFRYFSEEDVIHVSYETLASEGGDVSPRRQHLREVGQVIAMFSEYVAQGGDRGKVVRTQ
ncbi:hypothetical protein [Halanaeroarchaeum sulfurireducens]|nr:hypothetical protein [Halanaeroarchaeum sulfurireducens]ALG82235.1 hypothetical protein HLASA_1342 [Halanaeroarchaeum sulfurireducens]